MGPSADAAPMTEAVPTWLQAWRDGNCPPQVRPRTAKGIAPAKVRASEPAARPPRKKRTPSGPKAGGYGSKNFGFVEPKQWDYDGGERREPVLDIDHNPARVVRKVGWRNCMACTNPFFSEDVVALRICYYCKGPSEPRDQKKLLRE